MDDQQITTIVSSIGNAGAAVAIAFGFLRYLSGLESRQEARDDRLFAAIERIAIDKGEVIRANTAALGRRDDDFRRLHEGLARVVEIVKGSQYRPGCPSRDPEPEPDPAEPPARA